MRLFLSNRRWASSVLKKGTGTLANCEIPGVFCDGPRASPLFQHTASAWAVGWVIALVAWGQTVPMLSAAEPSRSAGDDLFESKIRPLLVERCQKCHGAEKQWSGLRLDSRDAVIAGGDNGPAAVVGDAGASDLVERISSADDEVRMPPPKEGPPLESEEIAAVRRWIELGMPWPALADRSGDTKKAEQRAHWAFQPIRRTEPPQVSSKLIGDNPIDRFVARKLEAAGLAMSPPADRAALIRRATYDLTGLPPTCEEVEAFVNDPAPDAYERLVERLLASPRYGEQWGRHWLDVARYSDTKGYVYAREERHFTYSSLYRDWVIRAFNEDLPYDRFVLLQLAADQVTPDNPSALAAMGYLTLGRRFIGVTPDIIDDRIDVVGRGLLGLTVGCARCHDHKYDPIPTADYYSLYGVFQNCADGTVAIPRAAGEPAPTAEFEKGLQERQQKLRELTVKSRAEAEARIRTRMKEYLLAQRELDKYPQLTFNQILTKEHLVPGLVRRWEALLEEADRKGDPVWAAWNAYVPLGDEEFAGRSAEVTRQLVADGTRLNPRVAAAFQEPPRSIAEVADRYVALLAEIDGKWKAACDEATRAGKAVPQALADAADEQVRQAFYGSDSPCVIPDESLIETEWYWDYDTLLELWKAQTAIDQWLLESPTSIPHMGVLNDRPLVTQARIFKRGNPANKGEVAPRQFLEVIAGTQRQPFTTGSGRLELARAIVEPTNPLTARVWVNRVWQHHFGAGLVATPSDFGLRSSPPSHPELLDWLASEFVSSGWSTKSLHRLIMLSQTYRQGSRGPADADMLTSGQESDPDNRLLWRMNSRRLAFEQYRDSLLFVAGDLDLKMGGKGTELFSNRRSVYTLVDRQFLPTVLSVFDYPNPDLHAPTRPETTTPQQALFELNHPFVAKCAKKLVQSATGDSTRPLGERIKRIVRRVLLRDPTPGEMEWATRFVERAQNDAPPTAPPKGDGKSEEAEPLLPLEQLAQVLLISNEFMFVD